jgi:hypothetical protein
MEDRGVARSISSHDSEWWTAPDEGYWQALLEQGEVISDVVPPVEPQESFQNLEIDSMSLEDALVAPKEAQASPSGDGWSRAQQALVQGESFHLPVVGANRGGLLVDWNGLQGFVPASHLSEMPQSRDIRERMTELARARPTHRQLDEPAAHRSRSAAESTCVFRAGGDVRFPIASRDPE